MALYSTEGKEFLFRIITVDESFLYYYDPESKQSSTEWKRADSPPLTKLKQEKSPGKVLYSFFLDHKGIILKELYINGYNNNKDILCRYFSE